jgi:hypothetical protein
VRAPPVAARAVVEARLLSAVRRVIGVVTIEKDKR